MASLTSIRSRSSSAQPIRSRALWAFLVAAIGLAATVAGLAQYVRSGAVSIRPGRDPLTGPAALESLLVLFLVSAVFGVLGAVLRRRAGRRGAA